MKLLDIPQDYKSIIKKLIQIAKDNNKPNYDEVNIVPEINMNERNNDKNRNT